MKAVSLSAVLFIIVSTAHAFDTLEILRAYDSPVPNPVSLEWDNGFYWTANRISDRLFRLSSDMLVVDSLKISGGKVFGIACRDSELWAGLDSIIADTVITGALFHNIRYTVCRIDKATGKTLESVLLGSKYINADTNSLPSIMGITFFNNELCFSDNNGWSSSVWYATPIRRITYAYVSGMLVMNGQIWGVRVSGNHGVCGDYIYQIYEPSSVIYFLPFLGRDMASDGNSIVICDYFSSRFCVMKPYPVKVGKVFNQTSGRKTRPKMLAGNISVNTLSGYTTLDCLGRSPAARVKVALFGVYYFKPK